MAFVVALVCVALVSIPLAAMMTVQLTSNQFVRETEQVLLKQAAVYAEIYRTRFQAMDGPEIGPELAPEMQEFWAADVRPIRAQINVRRDRVLPPLQEGPKVGALSDPRFETVLPGMADLARSAGKSTLAGVIFLDHQGQGTGEAGLRAFADLPEVQQALTGRVGTALRARADEFDRHPLTSISRDTGFRVFVAYPVLAQNRVIGVVLLSRTPLNLSKFLYRERDALIIMALFTLSGAALIGWLLHRLMSRPVRGLRDEARRVASGDTPVSDPLAHYGMRELADLGESMLSMADTLQARSREIAIYTDHVTHELKSPVTSIAGAAELLSEPALSPEDRAGLLDNIQTEAARMNTLLGRLRELSKLRQAPKSGPGLLPAMLPAVDGLEIRIAEGQNLMLPLSEEHGKVVLLHMAQNARSHGATEVILSYSDSVLRVLDNGEGISQNDADRLTEPFFTTRREEGGTGMGLAIVAAILEGYRATLKVKPSDMGAEFRIEFVKNRPGLQQY